MTKAFDYKLPDHRIAQWPVSVTGTRSSSRLLHARKSDEPLHLKDLFVQDLPDVLRPGDVIVFNNSRVRPSRFFPTLPEGKEAEVLLLHRDLSYGTDVFLALARPMKLFKEGQAIELAPKLKALPLGRNVSGEKLVLKLLSDDPHSSIDQLLDTSALMPIPPYIRDGRAEAADTELYQTVYSVVPGSVAAPTAGLHFTEQLLAQLEARGCEIRYITHHVGSASFRQAVQQDQNLERLEEEEYFIDPDLFSDLLAAKAEGRRVIAIGTTTTRALESFARLPQDQRTGFGQRTELCIKPPFEFKVVSALFTNFHQPGSTHLLLVSAFFGSDDIAQVYSHALNADYRFLSYGDAMFLERSV